MKHRKSMKLVVCTLAFVMVLGVWSTAFAAVSATKSWTSSVCKSQFRTSAYIVKTTDRIYETYWDCFYITPTKIVHSNGSPTALYATPKCTDGTTMGRKTLVYKGKKTSISSTNEEHSKTQVKFLITNPYTANSSNMQSAGTFYGESYSNYPVIAQ